MKEIAIVYMCAGLSSRFGGRIKQFAEVGPDGETLIEYSMNQALKAGFSKIVFIVGNMTEKPFKERFGKSYRGVPVNYALQRFDSKERDKPWGTADALISASEFLDCPFVVCNGDDIYGEATFRKLFEHLEKNKDCAMPGYRLGDVIPNVGTTNRGIIKVRGEYVKEIKEVLGIDKNNLKATNTKSGDLCSMNIFAFQPDVIGLFKIQVDNFKKKNLGNRKIECYLPVETSNLLVEEKIRMKIYPALDKWIGITNPEDEELVRMELKSGNRVNE